MDIKVGPDSSDPSIYRVRSDIRVTKNRRKKRIPTPVNVIIWAMEVLGRRKRGVSIEKIRNLVKTHFILPYKDQEVDKKIQMTVMFAVDFGIIEETNHLFFLKFPNH